MMNRNVGNDETSSEIKNAGANVFIRGNGNAPSSPKTNSVVVAPILALAPNRSRKFSQPVPSPHHSSSVARHSVP